LPSALSPLSSRHITFLYWTSLLWIAWVIALVVVGVKVWRVWQARKVAGTTGAPATLP